MYAKKKNEKTTTENNFFIMILLPALMKDSVTCTSAGNRAT